MTDDIPGGGRTPETRNGMFCDRCGNFAIYRTALVSGTGEFTCRVCHRRECRRVSPMYIVTGASGSGKTSIIQPLQELLPGFGVFDKDQLWAQNWDLVSNNYFRIASALAQGGMATVIVGTLIPEHLEDLSDRGLVEPIRYANLHCDPDTRRVRLLGRSTWQHPTEEFIRRHQEFAQWLLDHAATDFGSPMPTFDTTHDTPANIAGHVAAWVKMESGTG